DREPRRGWQSGFDFPGAVLVTAGMLLLIYALVRAPEIGWGTAETMSGLAAAAALLAAFVANERRARTPLVPFSIFRIKGLAAANVTQLITFSGLYSMFFFLSLYMQKVLGYSPSHTGLAYLPLTAGFMLSAGIATPLVPRIGTKPVIVAGALVAAAGLPSSPRWPPTAPALSSAPVAAFHRLSPQASSAPSWSAPCSRSSQRSWPSWQPTPVRSRRHDRGDARKARVQNNQRRPLPL